MLRQHQTAGHGASVANEEKNGPGSSPRKATLDNTIGAEHICGQMGITIDELTKGKKRLNHRNRRKVGHLKGMRQDELIAKAVHKRPTEEYAFKGLNSQQALIVVSHVREEIPDMVNEYVRLPGEEEISEQGRSVEMGRCDDGSIRTVEGWNAIWGLRI